MSMAFRIVQILLWMIQHANNHSVVQCNISPVMGFVRYRYNRYVGAIQGPRQRKHGIEVLSDL